MEKKYKNEEKRLEQQKRDNKTLKEAIQTSTRDLSTLTATNLSRKEMAKKEIRDQVQKKTLETHTIATLKVERQKFKSEYEKLKMDVAVQDRAIKQA